RDVAGAEGRIFDPGRRLEPMQPPGLFGPEAVGIGDRTLVHRAVVGLLDKGALRPLGGNIVDRLRHGSGPPRDAQVSAPAKFFPGAGHYATAVRRATRR